MNMNLKKIKEFNAGWFLKAFLMALLPLVCCLITCAINGQAIWDVYLPSCDWNDELFYFKQVEAIIHYGYPQGYFGFNESHALKLSFAAWSPVLVFPWVLWGLVFGWSLMSPIWCNLFLISLAIFLFVLLVKPSGKQLGTLAVLYCLFPLLTRYILSGMPEVICFSMLIVFYGVAISFLKYEQSNGKLVVLFVMTILLTLMRPYLLLFMFLPVYLWFRKYRKWWCLAGSAGIVLVTFGVYAMIGHYLSAEYLTPLYDTDFLEAFLNQGFMAGVKFTLSSLWYANLEFWARVIESFRSGLAEGAFFTMYWVVLILLGIHAVVSLRKKNDLERILSIHGTFAFVGMWFALLLMYNMKDGSKHFLTFIVVGIFLLSVLECKRFIKPAVVSVAFLFFLFIKADALFEYEIPFATTEKVEMMEHWNQVFEQEVSLELEQVPNYENVIIWVLSDSKGEGESQVLVEWQPLYAIPEGMGISCCYSDFVLDNIGQLKSKYIATSADGRVDKACQEAGFYEISRRGEVVVYRTK